MSESPSYQHSNKLWIKYPLSEENDYNVNLKSSGYMHMKCYSEYNRNKNLHAIKGMRLANNVNFGV